MGKGVLFREVSSVQGSGIEGLHTACVPWEKLSRAMHRPIPISDTSLSTSFEAGPAYNTHTHPVKFTLITGRVIEQIHIYICIHMQLMCFYMTLKHTHFSSDTETTYMW